jgi:hypothetical protein
MIGSHQPEDPERIVAILVIIFKNHNVYVDNGEPLLRKKFKSIRSKSDVYNLRERHHQSMDGLINPKNKSLALP